LEEEKWHFISFVRDKGEDNKSSIYTYIDGILDINVTGIELPDYEAIIPHIIGRDSRDIQQFKGQISDLRIWKTARTAEQIKNNMYLQLRGIEMGLVGYWRMGAISEGKIIDFTENRNDGIVHGNPYVSATTLKRSLDRKVGEHGLIFDGKNDYIALSESLGIFKGDFTVSMWVKVPKDGGGILLGYDSNDTGVNFEINEEGKLSFSWKGHESITGKKDLRDNKWHFIAFVRNVPQRVGPGIFKFFIDGQAGLFSGDSHSIAFPEIDISFLHNIGWDKNSTSTKFKGELGDIRIWEKARTGSQIKAEMTSQPDVNAQFLVAHWRLGSIINGKVIDSKNGNEGTVHGKFGELDYIKYRNSDLFAVTQRATYEESFEFKVNPANGVTADSLNEENPFTFSYWGKVSRSSDEEIKVDGATQNAFEDLGEGWYRASCDVTIPDTISMLRSFELDNINGDWTSIEIRKHKMRILSDSIREAKYTDTLRLTTLADQQADLATKLKDMEGKEHEEIILLSEKMWLKEKIASLSKSIDEKKEEITAQESLVNSITKERDNWETTYKTEKDNPLNYWCKLVCMDNEHWIARIYTKSKGLLHADIGANGNPYYNNNYFKFVFVEMDTETNEKYYKIICRYDNLELGASSKSLVYGAINKDNDYNYQWKPKKIENEEYYFIRHRATDQVLDKSANRKQKYNVCIWPEHGQNRQRWKISRIGDITNNVIATALAKKEEKNEELGGAIRILNTLKGELAILQNPIGQDQTLTKLRTRLENVNNEISTIETAINHLNGEFLTAVDETQQGPQAMPKVDEDSRGFVTQGALLGFVQPSSRLNAIETCEGNVQLSYFDTEGQMRQTNYDATSDSNNSSFEQWIPDAHRACLNLHGTNSKIQLNKPLLLSGDWSIEAWFVYPFFGHDETKDMILLTRGHHFDTQVTVIKGELGTYWGNKVLDKHFYGSGFNMNSLSMGWHHLTAVGKGDTVLFYIDGKKVGDIKAKAIADLEKQLALAESNHQATDGFQEKLKALHHANLKPTSNIIEIGNDGDEKQIGKLAEVRIWEIALTDEEVAVNSKILLTGNEPGLLAYYPLSEGQGDTIKDHTGNGHNGKITGGGATWWACTAPIGSSVSKVMRFNGIKDYIELTKPLPIFNDSFTISMWVRIPEDSGRGILLGDYGLTNAINVNFEITAFGKMRLYWNNEGAEIPHDDGIEGLIGGPDLRDAHWHFISFVVHHLGENDNIVIYFYCDGIEKKRWVLGTFSGKVATISHRIGCDGREEGVSFQGEIAELRIWNKARSKEEIKADKNKRLTGTEANLVAYYPLNEIRQDSAGNQEVVDLVDGNNGKLYGPHLTHDDLLSFGADALISNEYSSIQLKEGKK